MRGLLGHWGGYMLHIELKAFSYTMVLTTFVYESLKRDNFTVVLA